MKTIIEINGFEGLHDLERDIYEAIEEMDLEPEFQGTLKIEISYEEE